ncbi:cache domain-containing sensor histidine kinase [Gracilibacillus sp. D59]|uniref:cache domain-containing sensor histidine kinase n=1 Tax=Gracilibacillus sp. D59 TaxID=3457434 RepID=UPI003FCCDC9B
MVRKAILFLSKRTRVLTIRRRLFFAFLITSIIPVLLISYYSKTKYEGSLEVKLSSYSNQVVNEVTKNLNDKLMQYETLSEDIIINDEVQTGLKNFDDMSDLHKSSFLGELSNIVVSEIYNLKDLQNIHIRLPDGRTFYDLRYENYDDSQIEHIINEAEKSSKNQFWTYIDTKRGMEGLILGRQINNKENLNENLGYLLIVIDEPVFAKTVYGNIDLGSGSQLFIADDEGLVVSDWKSEYEKGTDFLDRNLTSKITTNSQSDTFEATFDGEKYLVTRAHIRTPNWYFVGMIPFEYINSESREVFKGLLIAISITIAISVSISLLIFLSIIKPMQQLVLFAQRVSIGDFKANLSDNSKDEMGKLSVSINRMVSQLKKLILKTEEDQKIKRNTELKMLQAQINPHFLFNTLNSFKWVAMLSRNKTLQNGLEALSVLLRNTIIHKDNLLTIKEEVDNLYHYGTIQKVRYGDSFSLHIDMEKDLEQYYILKFILQPIVENSIIHGTEEDINKTEINVQMKIINEKLHIVVNDNGQGFDMGALKQEKEDTKKLSGIGIDNVNERIKMNYGTEYGLTVHSEVGKGTTTTIVLPVLRQKER